MIEQPINSILVLRALPGLGDFLCITPTLRALRVHYPTAQLMYMGLPETQPLADRCGHLIDKHVIFPGFPGIPEGQFSAPAFERFLSRVNSETYDLVLQLHGSGQATNYFVPFLNGRITAGFYAEGAYRPDPDTFWPYPAHLHEVWRGLQLMQHLEIPLQGDRPEFPIKPDEYGILKLLPEQERPYVVLHPGGSRAARRWPAESFAQVADALKRQGLQVILTGGKAEQDVAINVMHHTKFPPLDMTGRTGLGELGALLHKAALVITNDTGVSHLAAALRTPSVVIFTSSSKHRWAPLNQALHRAIGPDLEHDHFDIEGDDPCALAPCATPEQVLEQAADLLRIRAEEAV